MLTEVPDPQLPIVQPEREATVFVNEIPVKPGRRVSLAEQARALAVVLREELGVPFAFFEVPHDGQAPNLVWAADAGSKAPLPPDEQHQLLADGQARVVPIEDGRYQLGLLIQRAGQPILQAVGELNALLPWSGAGPGALAGREQSRLQKWLQAVSDRLRLTDQMAACQAREEEQRRQLTACWEVIFTLNDLIHRLRIHKDQTRNRRRILEAALRHLDVQSLIWVPQQREDDVLVVGEPSLAPTDCRQVVSCLAPTLEARPEEHLLCNDLTGQSWGSRFPQLHNLLALALPDQEPLGWVLAVNKKAPEIRGQAVMERAEVADFRKSDAALLTPFVALLGLHVRASLRYQDLKELLVGLTRSLTAALDAKDAYTYGHSERVARIAVELGRELGLQGDELGDIYLAGLLHDVGKIGIRDVILSKREPLSPEEFEHIKQHVTIGYSILADLRPIRNLLPGVLYHHERIDGTGYPDGLVGENIPLLARILAVADGYDAMSTSRPYREALPCRQVEEILSEGAAKQWDKNVVEAFLRCRLKIHAIRQRGVGDSLRHAIESALRKDGSSTASLGGMLPDVLL
jgi:HD-GYP domain-containing protein (c-di-GMP phosphodiesterase class II)